MSNSRKTVEGDWRCPREAAQGAGVKRRTASAEMIAADRITFNEGSDRPLGGSAYSAACLRALSIFAFTTTLMASSTRSLA